MKAVVVTQAGGPEVLQVQDRPDPEPAVDQAVVRLAAANVNPTDVAARQGLYPPNFGIEGPPYVLGWDLAGEVVAVGDGVHDFSPGDHVVGMIPWYAAGGRFGAYAELVLLEAHWLVPLPDRLDPVQAATVPLNALTAQQALRLFGAAAGDELLITGASGAVGSFAVQLAKEQGLQVTAVAGTDDEAWVRELGADTVLPRDADLSAIGTFPYVFDAVPVGADAFPAAARGGTIVTTRALREKPDPDSGVTLRPMLIEQDTPALEDLVGQVAAGRLKTRVSQTVPLADAAEAHRLVEERGRRGKVVLVP
ncbi:NADP-dependent oxidoreductase [Patulibacter sp. SYSU D01012]|uniref:quinone oxidoreductase family protein n=1 Tax=Patulibacter sp. SYSU D01012 TaxID=2817381 RepID=UPI001B300536|nr:NADP-dependent oxidoreductase [Patulibacter sp. SYSU D01012]